MRVLVVGLGEDVGTWLMDVSVERTSDIRSEVSDSAKAVAVFGSDLYAFFEW